MRKAVRLLVGRAAFCIAGAGPADGLCLDGQTPGWSFISPGLNNIDFMSILLNQSLLRALRVVEYNSCRLKYLAAQ